MRRAFIALTIVAAAACAEPERPLLAQFFAASRLRDLTALRNIATIVFEPREQGTIATFDVKKVSTRREGQVETKDVTIVAPVRLPTGQMERKTLVVTMRRTSDAWLITAVRSQP